MEISVQSERTCVARPSRAFGMMGVIEAKLDSYAVGEDGKAGVRGRVVSKQGQIIAKSLMAGFLGGVSEAFDVNLCRSSALTLAQIPSTSLCSPTRCCREQQ